MKRKNNCLNVCGFTFCDKRKNWCEEMYFEISLKGRRSLKRYILLTLWEISPFGERNERILQQRIYLIILLCRIIFKLLMRILKMYTQTRSKRHNGGFLVNVPRWYSRSKLKVLFGETSTDFLCDEGEMASFIHKVDDDYNDDLIFSPVLHPE